MRRPPEWSTFSKYPVTAGTMLLAAGVSVARFSGRDVSALYETIAVRQGEVWRLVTSALPHGDAMHLFFNLYWTWVFGTLVEERFGHARTAGIFVLLAFVANGAEFALLDGGIGLSGVGYGLFGMLWVLSVRDESFRDVVDKNTVWLFVIWFFACIFMTYMGHPIANVAHGLGAGIGALLGYAISARGAARRRASGSIGGLVVLVLVTTTVARPWVNLSSDAGYDEARLGYEELVASKPKQALPWLRDAVRADPKRAANWFNYGLALRQLNRHEEADAAFKKASTLDAQMVESEK